jgi:hypothetical protein
MDGPRDPVFLERDVYRRKRLIDAIRVLPIAAALLMLVPAIMIGGASDANASTAWRGLYFFFLWSVLIMVAAFLVRRLGRDPADEDS